MLDRKGEISPNRAASKAFKVMWSPSVLWALLLDITIMWALLLDITIMWALLLTT